MSNYYTKGVHTLYHLAKFDCQVNRIPSCNIGVILTGLHINSFLKPFLTATFVCRPIGATVVGFRRVGKIEHLAQPPFKFCGRVKPEFLYVP